jgi:DNA-binding transcriptional LysR family regulator
MELRQLRYVVAVARHRNFTRAASECLIAQPALSTQVRKLESELGVRLFERTTRRVSLTAAGTVFVARAQRILAEASEAGREMSEHAEAIRGRVRIGAWHSVNHDLPDVLAGFSHVHPRIDLTIQEESSDVMLGLLRTGDLDVALLVMRDGLDLTGVEHVIYRTEPFVLIASLTSALAGRQRIELKDLASSSLIVFKPGSAVRMVVEAAFAVAGVPPRIAVETTETSAARAFVSAGLGVALVPRSVAAQPGPPVSVSSIVDAPTRTSAIAWLRVGGQSPARQALVAYLRERLVDGATAAIPTAATVVLDQVS